jgi:tRNA modification GTPase
MGKLATIVAEASPPGHGGVSIVRLSGPQVKEIAQAVLGKLPSPRTACFSSFLDEKGQVLDQGLALFFPAPHSFTSEDVLELQGHGGPVLIQLLIKRLVGLGARLARPGEFSERAFLNGKIDLAQAESIADLIHASTEQAARSALRSLQGEFSRQVHALVEALINLRIYIEAAIDFAEEEIDFLAHNTLKQRFEKLLSEVETLQQSAQQGSLLRNGISVVIAGKPNVGKSTLLNLLSGKELAIVTDLPGTTRDVLREQIQIDGLPLHLIDTAGLRSTTDPIEQEGIRRAQKEIEQADLILYLVDALEPLSEEAPAEHFFSFLKKSGSEEVKLPPLLIIRNKIDLTGEAASCKTRGRNKVISLSAKENKGLSLLKDTIKQQVGFSKEGEGTFSARQRHLVAIEKAQLSLKTAFQQLLNTRAGELIAEDLRQAQIHLSEITGEFSTEDLLGRIFSSFCIGK